MFGLAALEGSVRHRPVAAEAQYPAVDAGHGGAMTLVVVGRCYQAHIEPPEQGCLTVTAE